MDVAELARYTARSSVPPEIPLTLDIEPGLPLVQGHHDALSRALANVMLNAVEASETGNAITVGARHALLRGQPAIELSVRDSGRGIAPEHLARIWDPYMTQKPGGTGLGLAITRQTILAHGGEVMAESAPGQGTLVRFLLPVSRLETRS